MERNDCKLAQDLMPLRIEELCSEESKAFVDEHIAACPACAQVYGYMQATLPREREEKQKESASFKAAMAQFKKTLAWRRIRYVLTGLSAALLVVLVLSILTNTYKSLALDKYDITLKRTEDGQLLEKWDYHGASYGGYINTTGKPDQNGNFIIYLSHEVPLLDIGTRNSPYQYDLLRGWTFKEDGNLYNIEGYIFYEGMSTQWPTQLMEIRRGTEKDYEVLYRAGDELLMADQKETVIAQQYMPFAVLAPVPIEEMPIATPLPPAGRVSTTAPAEATPEN